ncbi:yciC [Symbiodinium microadriaticum]|nr:yciC [Symbiodinium microadriaticum]
MAFVGCISAAAGVVVAKLWTESEANEMDQRLEEVKRQALERSPAGIDPVVALRHLMEALDWSLANAGQHRLQSASDIVRECLNLPLREEAETRALGDSQHEELGRHLRKVRQLCSAPSQKRAPELRPQVHARRTQAASKGGTGSTGSTYDPDHGGTIQDKLGLSAALSYVVYEFLKLQHAARGCLQDTPRKSLRLALSSLAEHAAFAKGRTGEWMVPCKTKGKVHAQSWWRQSSCPEKDFRTAAVTVICILDAALSWSPLDLFGWMGKPEDVEGEAFDFQARRDEFGIVHIKASQPSQHSINSFLGHVISHGRSFVVAVDVLAALFHRRDMPNSETKRESVANFGSKTQTAVSARSCTMAQAWLKVAWIIVAGRCMASATPTLREALLTEAKHRLQDWFLNNDWRQHPPPDGRLDWPKREDGIQLQITTNNYVCDEESRIEPWEGIQLDKTHPPPRPDAIPITFGRFDVQNAEVIDVFNALADTKGEAEWDDLLMNGPGVTYLGDFPKEFARAAAVSFVARPFPDRQVFQWMVYNSTQNYDDMTVVYSTRRNAVLHQRGVEDEGWPAVQAQNCLGAYHVMALPQGGCHVVFTTMVNSHPPWPITAQFVFNIAWTKTAEYIEKLRARAQLLKRRRLAANTPASPVVPRWLLFDGMVPNKTESGDLFVEGVPKVNPPFQGPDYVVDVIQIDLLKDLERVIYSGGSSSMWLCALLVVALVVSAVVVRRRQRIRAWEPLTGDELETGLGLTPWKLEHLIFETYAHDVDAILCGEVRLSLPSPSETIAAGGTFTFAPSSGRLPQGLSSPPLAAAEFKPPPPPRPSHPSMPWTFSDHCFGWLQFARPVSAVPDQSPKEAALRSEKSPRITAPEFYLEIADDLPPTHQHKDTSDAVAEIHANFCAFQEQNQIFAPAAPVPLPVLIVTGFLGSGKTTLMKRLMNRRANLRIAALAHDLASKINIDASFLAAEVQPGLGKGEYLFQSSAWRDGDVAGLSGCACCPGFDDALGLAVKTALREGADRGLLDYLLLETSGAADPRQIVAALEVRFGPLARARLDRVVTVVDAERVLAEGHGWLDQKAQASCPSRRREEYQLQLAQLLVADVVLLNKVDICNDEPKALELLRQLCPHAKVLSCAFGDVPVPELLDVVPAPLSESTTVSHEDIPACWQVSASLESSRQNRALPGGLPAKFHHRVVEWSTRGGQSKPVQLTRFQSLLCLHLHRVRRWLRRGKGVLWVAEDPHAKWEWELSGQLRFSCRRAPNGFGGAAAFSSLVLIFADGVSEGDLVDTRLALSDLTVPPTEMAVTEEIVSQLQPDFEMLESTDQPDGCVRFRLTGHSFFNISKDLDISEPPYRIDLDALNRDLAQIVNAEKGAIFLATGEGFCRERGRRVLALLWPLGCLAQEGVPSPPSPLPAVLAAARAEAPTLLQRYFGHVTSCGRWHREMANTMQLHPKQIGQRSHAVNAAD